MKKLLIGLFIFLGLGNLFGSDSSTVEEIELSRDRLRFLISETLGEVENLENYFNSGDMQSVEIGYQDVSNHIKDKIEGLERLNDKSSPSERDFYCLNNIILFHNSLLEYIRPMYEYAKGDIEYYEYENRFQVAENNFKVAFENLHSRGFFN